MTSTTYTGVSYKTYYAKLVQAIQHVLPKVLRKLLAQNICPSKLEEKCKKKKTMVDRLAEPDKEKIRNAANKGYDDFDISLLYTLLRNLTKYQPTRFWGDPFDPYDHEVEIGDDIERCRRYRNHIVHRGNTIITDEEFNRYFDEFDRIVQRLEIVLNITNSEYTTMINGARNDHMDEELERKYLHELERLWMEIKSKSNDILLLEKEKKENTKLIRSLEKQTKFNGEIVEPLEDTMCWIESKVSLLCKVSGTIQCASQWLKDGQVILYNERHSQEVILESENLFQFRLTIFNAQKNDGGRYSVQIGDRRLDCVLFIQDKKPSLIELREYQKELAEVALKGENTIIYSGTNAGKTFVALYVIEQHISKNPNGKVAFLARTNVLVNQQYRRALQWLQYDIFKEKVVRWDAEMDVYNSLPTLIMPAKLLFITPGSLTNHLKDDATQKLPISTFSMIIFDECHHTIRNDNFNDVMRYYRRLKYSKDRGNRQLPQIVGLTASPGTNKSSNQEEAVAHLKLLMRNLSVYFVKSDVLENDTVTKILINQMEKIEKLLFGEDVSDFVLNDDKDITELEKCLHRKPKNRNELNYLQWIQETKTRVIKIFHKSKILRKLLACLKHLKVYYECLEMYALLSIKNVVEHLQNKRSKFPFGTFPTNTEDENHLAEKMKEVSIAIRNEIPHGVVENPDLIKLNDILEKGYEEWREDSRFIVYVKTRMAAVRLAELLPDYLKCKALTGSFVSKERGGCSKDEQQFTVENFRNGTYMCLVATAIAHEGLDIPECNLCIRYKFRANEISSLQMIGRVRSKEGKAFTFTSEADLEHEMSNIERQYLMSKAVEKVDRLDMSTSIYNDEYSLFTEEQEQIKRTDREKSQKVQGKFSVKCGGCLRFLAYGETIRKFQKRHYIVYDADFLKTEVKLFRLQKTQKFDGNVKTGKVQCNKCTHVLGSMMINNTRPFAFLSKASVNFFDEEVNTPLVCSWEKLGIAEMTDEEFEEYDLHPSELSYAEEDMETSQ